MSQANCRRPARNSIVFSSSPSLPNRKARNGRRSGSYVESAARLITAASFALSNSSARVLATGLITTYSAPVRVLLRYQKRLPSLKNCGATSSPKVRRDVFHGSNCSARL